MVLIKNMSTRIIAVFRFLMRRSQYRSTELLGRQAPLG